MLSNVKNWTIGGELTAYTQLMDASVEQVLLKLQHKAAQQQATYIIGVRLMTTQVSEGAAEIIAYGTAVK